MTDEKKLDFGEPWRIHKDCNAFSILTSTEGIVSEADLACGDSHIPVGEHAQRIVDCVNACAGYEISEVKDALKTWEREQELLTICDGWDTEEVREILSCASSVKHSDVDRGLAREKIALWKNEWTVVE